MGFNTTYILYLIILVHSFLDIYTFHISIMLIDLAHVLLSSLGLYGV
jgi:hypothetical protein